MKPGEVDNQMYVTKRKRGTHHIDRACVAVCLGSADTQKATNAIKHLDMGGLQKTRDIQGASQRQILLCSPSGGQRTQGVRWKLKGNAHRQ